MRLAKFSRTLLKAALPAVLATCVFAQEAPNVQPNAIRGRLMQPPSGGAQPQAAPQAPAPTNGNTPAKTKAAKGTKPAPTAANSPATGKPSAKTAPSNPAKTPVEKPAEEKVVRRDPFDTLITKAKAGNAPPENLPPGKAGLVVASLRIDGIVHNAAGTIAIVSNAQQRVYFLREGDKLYDGSVDKITLEAVSFHEVGKDAFGKPLERLVTKRLYPSPGEQQ
jgi:Tfp pilus assembly protein PilP